MGKVRAVPSLPGDESKMTSWRAGEKGKERFTFLQRRFFEIFLFQISNWHLHLCRRKFHHRDGWEVSLGNKRHSFRLSNNMKFQITQIVMAAVLFTAVGAEAQTKFASSAGYSKSIQINPFSYYTYDYGTITTYLTTYDGYSDRVPQMQPTGNNGLVYFSGELEPVQGQPGIYRADYLSSIASGYIKYGSIFIGLPIADSDNNQIPDLVQPDISVNTTFTGTIYSDYPSYTYDTIYGTLTRSAGSKTCYITFADSFRSFRRQLS